jgi:hypothetical protein
MKSNEKSKLFKIAAVTAVTTTVLMTCFETAKQLIYADISIWESHVATIIFTTMLSAGVTYYALKEHYALLRLTSSFIPMCAWCKKIRDKNGDWITLEFYLDKYLDAKITHGICSECSKKEMELQKIAP